jgi:hypothetical protein
MNFLFQLLLVLLKVITEQADIQQDNTTLQNFSFLKEYPVLNNEHTATQDSIVTIPAHKLATPKKFKNKTSGSQSHGDNLLGYYQVIQVDFLPSGIVTANTRGIYENLFARRRRRGGGRTRRKTTKETTHGHIIQPKNNEYSKGNRLGSALSSLYSPEV